MHVGSITHTSETQGDEALLYKWHNISSMERVAAKFIQVSTRAAKNGVTVTADGDRTVTIRHLTWPFDMALRQAVIAFGCPALGWGTPRP